MGELHGWGVGDMARSEYFHSGIDNFRSLHWYYTIFLMTCLTFSIKLYHDFYSCWEVMSSI